MKANELGLRIGNLVSDKGNVCTVDAIDIYGYVYTEDETYDDQQRTIKPEGIPLTEEWLLKFGFVKTESMEYKWLNAFEIPNWGRIVLKDGVIETDEYYFLDGLTQEIKFVHQLQNLYFALTGKELTIKDY